MWTLLGDGTPQPIIFDNTTEGRRLVKYNPTEYLINGKFNESYNRTT